MNDNKKYNILWVDDEVELFTPHVRILEKQGYTTHTVNNGHDAIALVEKKNYDLVLLDIMMPGKDGITVLEELKALNPSLPVVMITKSEDDLMIDSSLALRAEYFLVKPLQPRQLIAVCKKVLEQKYLVKSNYPPRYSKEVKYLKDLFVENTSSSWIEVAKKLSSWTSALSESTDQTLIDIHNEMRKEADSLFTNFITSEYRNWLESKSGPMLPHHFLERIICPLIGNKERVLWIIFDCMRVDQWMEISSILHEHFSITTDYYFSLIPSATPYSRNSFFSTMTPRDTVIKHPEFLSVLENPHQNRFEKDFLLSFFSAKTKNAASLVAYKKIINSTGEKSLLKEIKNLSKKSLVAVIIDFIDMLSHSISRNIVLEEMIQNISSLRKITGTWFSSSPLFKAMLKAREHNMTIVVTTDHGSIKVKRPAILKNARGNVSSNLRYKYGDNLSLQRNHKSRGIVIEDPESWGLPMHSDKTNYVISIHDSFLVYPTNPETYTRQYTGTIQHGGISLEEMVIPYAILKPR